MHRLLRMAVVPGLAAALLGSGVADGRGDVDAAQAADPVVLVGAGDIAACDQENDEATAKVLDGIPGTVFTLGDNVYTAGSSAEFAACYDPNWGRHKARTRPAAGNHDYITPGGAGYYAYFGESAGPVGKGYYSYSLGAWKIIVLNTNCRGVADPTVTVMPDPDYRGNPCDAGSPQAQWLREQLESSPDCTLAISHYPLSTSGQKAPGYAHVKPLWELLYQYGADVMLSGDDHVYERFARQRPDKVADPVRGVRQFTIGTGGNGSYAFKAWAPHSEVFRGNDPVLGPNYGVMKFTLSDGSYSWEFVPVAGNTFTDSGTEACSRGLAPNAVIGTQPDPPIVQEGDPVTFDGSATTDDRTPLADLRFEWDFEDDGVWDATGEVVTHTYAAVGSYRARLRVTDADGATDTATVGVTVNSFCPTATFSDDVEPGPEAGWQVDTAQNDNPASATWQPVVDPNATSPTQSWFSDASTPSFKDDRLVAPPVDLSQSGRLSFWHRYRFENGFDGGLLEVSRDGGTTWEEIPAADFLEGGYTGVISTAWGNPIGGKAAWTGGSGATGTMTRVVVDLGGFEGQDVLVRWRLGTDELGDPGHGWWIDDVEISGIPLPCNRPPVARDDTASVKKNKSVTVSVLANDSDPDGDALTVASATQPAHGSVTVNAGRTVTYEPAKAFRGTDSFTYTVDDGNGGSATARVAITVT